MCVSEVEGKEALADPNREIGFGFVSCSCRACVRAGEAKLRERVRDDAFSSLVARMARCAAPPPVALDFVSTVSEDSLQGFKKNVAFWKTVSRVVRKLLSFWMTVSRVLKNIFN